MSAALRLAPMEREVVPFSFQAGGGWYCVHTAPKAEFRVRAGLEAMGYETFLPTETKWIRHARYKRERVVPLLAGYVFVFLDPNFGWEGLSTVPGNCSVEGAIALLSCTGIPTRIPNGLIGELAAAAEAGDYDEVTAIGRLPVGSAVRVMDGPLKGFVAELKAADSAEKRAEIFVNMLGGCKMVLEFAKLRPV